MNDVRKKSPRAPTLALPDALERVEKVYAAEGRHATPTEIVAQALGYKSATNGSAAQTIASLRYYGLLERPKEGFLAVSKDYENYKFSPEESQKQALVIGWLRTPSIFSTLLEKYDGRLPSDATIRYDFIGLGFLPSGADAYVGVFRRSVEFARFYERPSEPSQDDLLALPTVPEQPVGQPPEVAAVTQSQPPHAVHVAHAAPIAAHNPDVIRLPIRLPKERMAWLELPIPFYEADKDRLKAYIDMQLADDPDDE